MAYLRYFLIFTLSIVTLVASTNWFIDPYGFFWSPQISNINAKKTQAVNRSRLVKPYRLDKTLPEILLIGNSRIEMGIPAESELFTSDNVYNAGIPGLRPELQWQMALNQIQTNPNLKKIFLSLDYTDFLIQDSAFGSAAKTRTDTIETDYIKIAQSVFSFDTLISSIKTILTQNSDVNYITAKGTNVPDTYISVMRTEGKSALFKQKLGELKNTFSREHVHASHDSLSHPYHQILDKVINNASAKNIEITFFINPLHITYIEEIEENHKVNDFCRWKNQLATYIGSAGNTLWDFSLISPYALEPVNLSKNNEAMQWFWEPAHYKSSLSEILLPLMANGTTTNSIESCEIVEQKLKHYRSKESI